MWRKHALKRAEITDKLVISFLFLALYVFFLICIIPFWLVFINSFAQPRELVRGFQLFPSVLTLETYDYLLNHSSILTNFVNSVLVTCTGTVLAVLISAMLGYGLAHPKVKKRYVLSFMTYIPMILGSGMVGFYLLVVRYLHLKDTYWAMILPYVVNPFYVFIMVSFYRTIPYELMEAACVDGADDFRTFFQIVWPLSRVPVLTVTLFYALSYWNDWWLAMLFVNDTTKQPLQILIRNITSQQEMASIIGSMNGGAVQPVNVQLATVCLTIGPIILLYPFLQKYFVKGIIVGAVKG